MTLLNNVSMDVLIRYGLQALSALLILGIGLYLGRWIGDHVHRWLGKFEIDPPLQTLLSRLVRGLVLLLTLLITLEQFGVQVWPLIAGLGIIGVGVGLAVQGVLRNLVAGLTIIFTKPFRVGEYIELLGVYGEVKEVGLFSTKLIHLDRSLVVIPNRKIIGEVLHNYGKIRQLDLNVGVAYGTDLNAALIAVRQVIERNAMVLKEHAPLVGISALGDSAITISAKPWVKVPDFAVAQAELYRALIERFRADNVQIPFPQHEVRLLNAV